MVSYYLFEITKMGQQRLDLPPKWNNQRHIHTQVRMHTCTKQQEMKGIDPLETGNKWGELMLLQLTAMRKFSCHGAGRENPRRAQYSPYSEEIELSVQGGQDSKSSLDRIPGRRGMHKERALEICKQSSLIIEQSTDNIPVRRWPEPRGRIFWKD